MGLTTCVKMVERCIVQVWGAEGDQPELAGGAPPCWKRRLRREMARVQEEEPMA